MAKAETDATSTNIPAPIQLDQNLIAAIATAVAMALKGQAGPQFSMEELGTTIGDAVAAGIAKTTRRKVTFGEYQLTGHSPFHPKPLAETPKLKRPSWQNGIWMNPVQLYDEEIVLLNTITHSGRYVDRLVEVGIRNEGGAEEVDIRFPNKDINDQLMMKGHCKDFIEMLKMIKAEQDVERTEREEQDAVKRSKPRQSFSAKATVDARERAEA